ncbi:DUF2806 domain-containing protein [Rhizobium leguminosarum]
MTEPTDSPIGIEVNWSQNGFSAKLRSRLLSALDRFGATKIEQIGLDAERQVATHRAMTDAHLELLTAAASEVGSEIRNDPKLAQKALAAFARAERQTENIHGSVVAAIEDLRDHPASDVEQEDAPEVLDPDFMNRWETYAGGATAEAVRLKWGQILASEIREPGTFDLRTLRIVDELDRKTAVAFQTLCEGRIGGSVPNLLRNLSPVEISDLEEAGLIVAGPRFILPEAIDAPDGSRWWAFSNASVGILISQKNPPSLLEVVKGQVKLPVTTLTQAGRALSSIFSDNEDAAFRRLFEILDQDGVGAVKFGWVVDRTLVDKARPD